MKSKTLNILATKAEDNSYYQFELIGFNEVYCHDNNKQEAYFLERTFGAYRCKSPLQKKSDFEGFKFFSKMMFLAMIEAGDGFVGTEADANLDYELDMRIIALSGLEFSN